MPTVVLASGGIDSTAATAFHVERGDDVNLLYVDFGQPAADRELRAVRAVSQHYDVPLTVARTQGWTIQPVMPGRNGWLVHFGVLVLAPRRGFVVLGIHAGTDYADSTPLFVSYLQKLIDEYTAGTIQLSVPWLRWSKRAILDYCERSEVPIGLTYSCELGLHQPCGTCSTCKELERLSATGT